MSTVSKWAITLPFSNLGVVILITYVFITFLYILYGLYTIKQLAHVLRIKKKTNLFWIKLFSWQQGIGYAIC